MKKIFLIRHGESEANTGPLYGNFDSKLTKNGFSQVLLAYRKIKKIPIEVIISSPMKRAEQTANLLSRKTCKPIVYSKLFCERRRPSEQNKGLKKNSRLIMIEKLIRKNFTNNNFRYSDEENINDLIIRAKQALNYLAAIPENNILVVTHGLFMRILVITALFDLKYNRYIYKQLIDKLGTENTGVTTLCFKKKPKPLWYISVWNDHSHLY